MNFLNINIEIMDGNIYYAILTKTPEDIFRSLCLGKSFIWKIKDKCILVLMIIRLIIIREVY